MTMVEFLILLGTGAGAMGAASFLLERWAWFQALKAETRGLVVLCVAVVVALIAFAVARFVPSAILQELQVWFQVVYTVVIYWLASQVAHRIDVGK